MFRRFFIIISAASTLQFLFAELVFDNMEINDKIKEGYLEIQVSGCRDLSGNEANLTVMK